jgi:hypothetical protein
MFVKIIDQPDLHVWERSKISNVFAARISGKDVVVFVAPTVLKKEDIPISLPEVVRNISLSYASDSACCSAFDTLYPDVQSIFIGA